MCIVQFIVLSSCLFYIYSAAVCQQWVPVWRQTLHLVALAVWRRPRLHRRIWRERLWVNDTYINSYSLDLFTNGSQIYECHFINLYLTMVLQYLESTLHTLVVAMWSKPVGQAFRLSGTTLIKMVCINIGNRYIATCFMYITCTCTCIPGGPEITEQSIQSIFRTLL